MGGGRSTELDSWVALQCPAPAAARLVESRIRSAYHADSGELDAYAQLCTHVGLDLKLLAVALSVSLAPRRVADAARLPDRRPCQKAAAAAPIVAADAHAVCRPSLWSAQ